MKQLTYWIGVLVLCMVAFACSNDSKQDIPQNVMPPPVTNTYTASISNIMDTYSCTLQGCHAGATPAFGILLTDYQSVRFQVENGRLLGTIKHEAGFSPMPKNLPKMAQEDIDRIDLWVSEGYPE